MIDATQELTPDTSFNVLDSKGSLIGTIVSAKSSQTWVWDLDKGSPWPAEDIVLQSVSKSGDLGGENLATYVFENKQTWHSGKHTIYGPYYIIEDGAYHWRFQYDSDKKWLYWVSNSTLLLPGAVGTTLQARYDGPGHSHTSSYYRKDDQLS